MVDAKPSLEVLSLLFFQVPLQWPVCGADVHSECAVAALEIGLVNPAVRNIILQARHVCLKSSHPQRDKNSGGIFSPLGHRTQGFCRLNFNVHYFCYWILTLSLKKKVNVYTGKQSAEAHQMYNICAEFSSHLPPEVISEAYGI